MKTRGVTTEKENKKERRTVPFASVKMSKHKMFTQGGSWIVSVPPPFAKAIETLQDRRLRSLYMNSHLIYQYEKFFHNIEYNLLQVALDCFSAIYHIIEDKETKKIIKDIHDKATILQEYMEIRK